MDSDEDSHRGSVMIQEGGYSVGVGYSINQTNHLVKSRSKKLSGAVLKMIIATACIGGAVATWVTMAEVIQKLNENYLNHYFMIWFVQSAYSLMYVVWALWRYFPYFPAGRDYSCNSIGEGSLPLSKKLIIWSAILAVIYAVNGYAWYLSLTQTDVPANAAIFQCTTAVVFIISVPLLKERVTVLKVTCVLLSIGGVFVVAFFSTNGPQCIVPATNLTNSTVNESASYYNYDYEDPTDSNPCHKPAEVNTAFGYIMLIVSVVADALFNTLFKKFATVDDDKAATLNGLRVQGYIGMCTLFLLWPPIIILHFTGYEVFKLPPTTELLGLLFLDAILEVAFNSCLVVSIALSSPLYTSVGSVMATPVSVLVDWIVQQFLPSALAFVGIALILSGFIGFVISEVIEIRRESEHKRQIVKLSKRDIVSSGDSSDECKPLIQPFIPPPTLRSRILKILF